MATTCWAPVKGKVARVTKVDGCGNPVLCADGITPIHAVSDGVISIEFEPEIDEGDDIESTNWNGDSCVDLPACPRIRWMNVTMTFCRVDPCLFSMLTSVPIITDAQGNVTGFRVRKTISCEEGVALEVWTGSQGIGRCTDANPLPLFGYLLTPWVVNGVLGSYTIENGAVTFTITARGIDGGNWGVGPYDVYLDAMGNPAPLQQPIIEGDVHHVDVTTLPPPAPFCGCNCDALIQPPQASCVANGNSISVTWDNSPNGPVVINWGDASPTQGGPEAGVLAHVYAVPGPQTIRVSDANNPNNFIELDNCVTTAAALTASVEPDPGDPQTAIVTYNNQGQGVVNIDWGDGNMDTPAGASPQSHTYVGAGPFNITVVDADDALRIVMLVYP